MTYSWNAVSNAQAQQERRPEIPERRTPSSSFSSSWFNAPKPKPLPDAPSTTESGVEESKGEGLTLSSSAIGDQRGAQDSAKDDYVDTVDSEDAGKIESEDEEAGGGNQSNTRVDAEDTRIDSGSSEPMSLSDAMEAGEKAQGNARANAEVMDFAGLNGEGPPSLHSTLEAEERAQVSAKIDAEEEENTNLLLSSESEAEDVLYPSIGRKRVWREMLRLPETLTNQLDHLVDENERWLDSGVIFPCGPTDREKVGKGRSR